MNRRKISWLALFLIAVAAIPLAAFADAKGDVTLVAEKAKAIYAFDHFAINGGKRTIAVTIKATWVENLRPAEETYEVEVRPGEKKLFATEHPPQANFKTVVTGAHYK